MKSGSGDLSRRQCVDRAFHQRRAQPDARADIIGRDLNAGALALTEASNGIARRVRAGEITASILAFAHPMRFTSPSPSA
jgi:hypothetical protein